MARVMRDSVTASNIPSTNLQLVAGYIDGLYRWSAADWARFPTQVHVTIAVFASTAGAMVYDVETGDLIPAQVPGVLQRERAAGRNPTIYCNPSNHQAIIDAVVGAGLSQPPYWIAHYTFVPHMEPGSVATQWTDVPPSNPYDESLVLDFWPGVDHDLPTAITKGTPMHTITPYKVTNLKTDGNGNGWTSLPGVSADGVVSVAFNGIVPELAGVYVAPALWDADNVGGNAQINIYNHSVKNGFVTLTVWIASA